MNPSCLEQTNNSPKRLDPLPKPLRAAGFQESSKIPTPACTHTLCIALECRKKGVLCPAHWLQHP